MNILNYLHVYICIGSYFIVCTITWAVSCRLESLPRRVTGESEIGELDLRAAVRLDLRTHDACMDLFRQCCGKVDVILDPYRNDFWIPYYEGKY